MDRGQIVSQRQISLEGVTIDQLRQLIDSIIKGKHFKELFNGENIQDSRQQEEQTEEV